MWNPFSFLAMQRLSVDEEIAAKPAPMAAVTTPAISGPVPKLLTTVQLMSAYGKPGDPDNMVTITTPFRLRVAWDLNSTTNRILCHKKVADRLLRVFNELLQVYGAEKIQALGIDLFGGMYNFRPQRGLENKYAAAIKAKNFALANTYLSRHSWATAIDLDPARNQLKTKAPKAQFSKPEYKTMINIFYKHGFISYGIERNNDWMHFEIGVLL